MICEGELKGIVAVIKGIADSLIDNYTDDIPICEICLHRLELAVKLLREEKNKTVDK